MERIWLAFLTGLTTGAVSCFVVQGGLLASALTQNPEASSKNRYLGVGVFLLAKIFIYTLLGGFLGYFGSKILISSSLQAIMQIAVGIFLFLTAARLMDLHPFFRRLVIQPPKSFFRFAKNKSAGKTVFAPAILGFSTVLIPCGVTQAMILSSISSQSVIYGSIIMFAFTLGTSPIFFLMGISTAELLKKRFLSYVASFLVLILGVLSLNSGLGLFGFPYTLQNLKEIIFVKQEGKINLINGMQEVEIRVENYGYRPSTNTLKANIPVRLKLITDNTIGCSRAFVIPSLGISRYLPPNGISEIVFTPLKSGKLTFSCSMGMYTGYFEVVE